MKEKPLYDQLKDRKNNGEILNFDNISYDELVKLWWEESLPDSMIAELFDVNKKKVTRKRNEMGITQGDMLTFNIFSKIDDFYSKQAEKPLTVEKIIEAIDKLSESDRDTLLLHLKNKFNR